MSKIILKDACGHDTSDVEVYIDKLGRQKVVILDQGADRVVIDYKNIIKLIEFLGKLKV